MQSVVQWLKRAAFSPAPSRAIELDFVRGIAILLALGWHFNPTGHGSWYALLLFPGHYFGWAGVDVFFVLSGFLIGGLVFKEYQKTGGFREWRFLIRRAFKIWPILYLFLLLQLVSDHRPASSYFFQNLFHVQNYFTTPIFHLWSLAVEEHFYLAAALLFPLALKTRYGKSHVPHVLVGIMITSAALRYIATYYGVERHDIQIQSQYRIDALACGVWLAYLNVFDREQFERLARNKALLLGLTIAGFTLLGLAGKEGPFRGAIGFTLSYMTGATLLLCCYRAKAITNASLLVRVVAAIGVYSYAMYVYQMVPARFTDEILQLPSDDIGTVLLRYGGTFLIAVVVTRVIERPFLAWRDRIFAPDPAPVPPVAPAQTAP